MSYYNRQRKKAIALFVGEEIALYWGKRHVYTGELRFDGIDFTIYEYDVVFGLICHDFSADSVSRIEFDPFCHLIRIRLFS